MAISAKDISFEIKCSDDFLSKCIAENEKMVNVFEERQKSSIVRAIELHTRDSEYCFGVIVNPRQTNSKLFSFGVSEYVDMAASHEEVDYKAHSFKMVNIRLTTCSFRITETPGSDINGEIDFLVRRGRIPDFFWKSTFYNVEHNETITDLKWLSGLVEDENIDDVVDHDDFRFVERNR